MSRARVHDEVARARALVALHETLGGAEIDLDGLLQLAADEAVRLLGDVAGVWVQGSLGVELRAYAHHDPYLPSKMPNLPGGLNPAPSGLIASMVGRLTPLVASGAELIALLPELESPYRRYVERNGLSGLVLVPLASRDQPVGVIGVARDQGGAPFNDEETLFLEQIGRVVSLAIAHAQLLAEVGDAHRRATLLSLEDELTGLLNRRGFLEVLQDRAVTPAGACAVVAVLDMDGFKLVNDGFGHAAGDLVLVSMSARLCGSLPPNAPVARIGGDEFAVLIEAESAEAAASIVACAVRSCTGTFPVVGLSVPMTVSVGTAVLAPEQPNEALRQADLAMYRAKLRGATVAAYDPLLDDPASRRLKDVLALRRSIAAGELVVHYQPVVSVGPGPLRVEALVRRMVDGRLVLPQAWLQMAERAGLMPEVTESVVAQTVAQLATWWSEGLEVECAVNIPAPVLTLEVVAALIGRLDEAALPRRALSVEVTEGDLVGILAKSALVRCAEADIGVAVDDFGTGWSALSYLVDLPLRTLKIDRTFVDGIDLDPRRAAVVRAVIDVAHQLGLRVVAEGIETVAEADLVIDLGADALQGYLYGRPVAADAAELAMRSGLVASHS